MKRRKTTKPPNCTVEKTALWGYLDYAHENWQVFLDPTEGPCALCAGHEYPKSRSKVCSVSELFECGHFETH